MGKEASDPAMRRIANLFEKSGKTLDELGRAMGYDESIAKKSAWQFINRTNDPRLSMLRKFAQAMGIQVEELVADKKK
jgi:transcriptional regulator with XRE-family HTH domain